MQRLHLGSLDNREAELGFGISKGRSHIVKWETASHGLGGIGRSETVASSGTGNLGRPGIQVQVEWPEQRLHIVLDKEETSLEEMGQPIGYIFPHLLTRGRLGGSLTGDRGSGCKFVYTKEPPGELIWR